MKGLLSLCCLLAVFSLALAEVKAKAAEKKAEVLASDKSSDSKPKRDASLLAGNYHGPSYKYLPPGAGVASSYDTYAGAHHGLAASVGSGHHSAGGFGGSYSSGFGSGGSGGSGYSGGSLSHHSSGHHGLSSAGLGYASSGHHGVSSSGLAGGYSGHSAGHSSGHSSGHLGGASSSGLGYVSSGHYAGHDSGIKGGSHGYSSGPSYTVSSLGHGGYSGRPSYSGGHSGFASSGSNAGHGYNTHSVAVPSYSVSSGHVGSSGPSYSLSSAHGGSSVPSFAVSSGHGGSSGPSYSLSSVHGGSSVPSFAVSSGHGGSSGGGYHYSKGGSSGSSSGFGAVSGSGVFGSSHNVHSSDHSDDFNHVHNGELEHHYNVADGHAAGSGGASSHSAGFGGSNHGAGASSLAHQGGYNYESPIQQHALPASSYGVPIATVGDAYATNYQSQQAGVQELGPVYAAGHKGLGHFGFSANKPQVLHTSISGSSGFKQPSYAKAPFKPSAFLGSKYEGSSNEAPTQQYLPPSGSGAEASGYDYPIPSGPSSNYQESNQYQTSVEAQATPIHEPEATYLPPNNNEGSYNDINSAGSASYLPPGQSYNGPYNH